MFPHLLGDAPENRTAHWQPGAETRSSFSILWSCLVTLSLCIWTAVHMNVPEHDPRPEMPWYHFRWLVDKPFWRKVKWLVMGMLAPEMIAFTAFVQRREARELTTKLQHILALPKSCGKDVKPEDQGTAEASVGLETPGNLDAPRTHPWTNSHSFYANMGGFAFDTHELPENKKLLPGNRERVVVSRKGIIELSKIAPSLIPDLSTGDIEDKNKANVLARFLACWQALWFATQVIFRLGSKHCVTLLEINTFAHAICALIAYWFWWEKPLDVKEPSIIRPRAPQTMNTETMHRLLAVFCFFSKLPSQNGMYSGEYIWLKYVGLPHDSESSKGILPTRPTSTEIERFDAESAKIEEGELQFGQNVEGFTLESYWQSSIQGESYWKSFIERIKGDKIPKSGVKYGPKDRRRWALASKYFDRDRPRSIGYHALNDRINNWGYSEGAITLSGLVVAGLFYSACHLIAWEAPFTSNTQGILWRLSGLAIAILGPVFWAMDLLYTWLFVPQHNINWPDPLRGSRLNDGKGFGWIVSKSYMAIWVSLCLLYLFARVYLVLECFISFAYLPESAFVQAQWTYWIPHIS